MESCDSETRIQRSCSGKRLYWLWKYCSTYLMLMIPFIEAKKCPPLQQCDKNQKNKTKFDGCCEQVVCSCESIFCVCSKVRCSRTLEMCFDRCYHWHWINSVTTNGLQRTIWSASVLHLPWLKGNKTLNLSGSDCALNIVNEWILHIYFSVH